MPLNPLPESIPKPKPATKWYALGIENILEKLKTSKNGLTEKEVQKRLAEYGPNQLPTKEQDTSWQVFIRQFKSSMVYILLAATLVSLALSSFIDAGIIFLAVIINVIIGFYQERKVQKSLAALEKVIVSTAKVSRQDDRQEIDAQSLVPGDIVYLEQGDKVPADLRLIKAVGLKTNEASLTGESSEVDKDQQVLNSDLVLADQKNMVFMGTSVSQGNALGVVVATGIHTAIGRIAHLVSTTHESSTPLQSKLNTFSRWLGVIVLVLSLLVLSFGLLAGHAFREMFVTAVAIAVSAIPEGLVVAVTVVLAVGMSRILKRRALVKKLLAAETLGSTQVICADKTGTLTEGYMRVVKIVTHNYRFDVGQADTHRGAPEVLEVVKAGVYNNNAYVSNPHQELEHRRIYGSATEKALLMAGDELGLVKQDLDKKQKRLDEVPFNSEWKFMLTLHEFDDLHNIVYLKGAPEKILAFSNHVYTTRHEGKEYINLSPEIRDQLVEDYESLSKQGLRVLALAYKKVVSTENNFNLVRNLYTDFIFLGLVGLKDPLRSTAKEMVGITTQAGIKTVMITGDHKLTAKAIGRELGIKATDKNILTGEELSTMSESDLVQKISDITIYARVSPEDKLKIVKAWQDKGLVVAMTGDGINDSPALKKADIGIALGSGTEVAKETADIVLLNDDFGTIVAAVKEGRVIYDNIKKIILYFLSDSFTEMFVIIVSLILGWPLPLLASQIIWVNLIDDTLPAMSLTQEPANFDIMQEKPQQRGKPILDTERKTLIVLVSLFAALGILFVFWFFWRLDNEAVARTAAFVVLGLSTLVYIFSLRNIRQPVWHTNFLSNKFLLFSVLFGVVLQILPVYNPFLQKIFHTVPLGFAEWIIVVLVCLLVAVMIELTKWFFIKRKY